MSLGGPGRVRGAGRTSTTAIEDECGRSRVLAVGGAVRGALVDSSSLRVNIYQNYLQKTPVCLLAPPPSPAVVDVRRDPVTTPTDARKPAPSERLRAVTIRRRG